MSGQNPGKTNLFRAAFAVALSAGLLFGASQALQGTVVASCLYDPPTFLGSCLAINCEQVCSQWRENYVAWCDSNNCCICFEG